MSVTIMTAVWRMDLPSTDKMVLLALADAANDDGVTWIAVQSRRGDRLDLLTKTSLSERAIQGAVKRLCDAGHLTRDERPGKGVIYTVTPASPAPPQDVRPAGNDADPRTSCGETVSNHLSSGTSVPSERRTAARGTRLPDGWTPKPDEIAFALAEGLTAQETNRAADEFRDYWRACPGQRGVKLDWSATWRNWCRRAAGDRKGVAARPAQRPGGGQGVADFAAIAARRERERRNPDDVPQDRGAIPGDFRVVGGGERP